MAVTFAELDRYLLITADTLPPFAPRPISPFEDPQIGSDHERRWAGLQAHNRWLADFCAEAPGRRAGVAQIFLPNIEGSVEEIRWAKEIGLTGGVLVPGAPPLAYEDVPEPARKCPGFAKDHQRAA